MTTLRVLHLSDLMAGAPGFDDLRTHILRRDKHLEEPIDYIAVSGNLTAAGTPDQFGQAEDLLQALCQAVDWRGVWSVNRLVVVPGPFDRHGDEGSTGSLHAFKAFYDRLFRDEMDPDWLRPFDPETAILRELKDVTFLGVWCWGDQAIHELRDQVRRAAEGRMDFECCRRTPTVLVSSDCTGLDRGSLVQGLDRDLRRLAEETLRLDFHLVGAGHVYRASPNPLVVRRICYGTGPKPPGQIWPHTLSVIELPTVQVLRRAPRDGLNDDATEITYYHLHRPDAPEWIREAVEDRDAVREYLRKRMEPTRPRGPVSVIERVIDGIRAGRRRFLLLSMPGSGARIILDGLKDAGGACHVHHEEWRDYGHLEKRAEAFETNMDGLRATVERERASSTNRAPLVLVLHDYAYGSTSSDATERHRMRNRPAPTASDRREEMVDDFVARFLAKATEVDDQTVVIYHVHDNAAGGVRAIWPRWSPDCFDGGEIRLNLIAPACLHDLLSDHLLDTPVHFHHIRRLTGGTGGCYGGFGVLLARASESEYEDWDGARPVVEEACQELLLQALQSQAVEKEIEDLLRYLERHWSHAPMLARFLEGRVSRLVGDASRVIDVISREDPCVQFRMADVLTGVNQGECKEIELELDTLAEYGVLGRVQDGYRLNVIVPFLQTARRRPPAAAGMTTVIRSSARRTADGPVPAGGPEPGGDALVVPSVFVCYGGRDQVESAVSDNARGLVEIHLRPYVQGRHGRFRLVYDGDRPSTQDLDPWIHEQLNSCSGAILLVGQHFLLSPYVTDVEMPVLLQRRSQVRIPILVLILEDCDAEEMTYPVPQANGDVADIALKDLVYVNPTRTGHMRRQGRVQPWDEMVESRRRQLLLSMQRRLRKELGGEA